MQRRFAALCFAFLTLSVLGATAQVNPSKEGTPGVTGYKAEVMAEVMIQEDKLTRLAEAIPADKILLAPRR